MSLPWNKCCLYYFLERRQWTIQRSCHINNANAIGTQIIELDDKGNEIDKDGPNTKQATSFNEDDISDLTVAQTHIFKALMAAGVSLANVKAMAIKFNKNLADCYFKLIQ